MIEKWRSSGIDIVQAVKAKRGRESLASKLGALFFYVILNKLSGFELKAPSDFKLMNRQGSRHVAGHCANVTCSFAV